VQIPSGPEEYFILDKKAGYLVVLSILARAVKKLIRVEISIS